MIHGYLNLDLPSEAVQVYRRCRQTLCRSLGIQPRPASENIYRQIGSG
ncbi:MAG: bacterial transcriptional activator domain-containing protein [Gammaproteobacteria bacterium]